METCMTWATNTWGENTWGDNTWLGLVVDVAVFNYVLYRRRRK